MKLGLGPWVVGAGRGVRGVGFGPALVTVVALRHPLGAGSSPGLLGGAGGAGGDSRPIKRRCSILASLAQLRKRIHSGRLVVSRLDEGR